jgi:hypothetical protein
MRKRGTIDLSLLDFETSNALATEFKQKVMRIEQLFQHAGLPSIEMPSANLYRSAFKFEVDNSAGIMHPAQVLLNSMILNFNPEKSGLESINLNRSNILGSKNLSNLWKEFKTAIQPGMSPEDIAKAHRQPFSGMKAGQKILMFDTETTGVDIGSQVRSFSLREMTIGSNGEILYDIEQPLMKDLDVGFKSPKLFGYKVANLNGGTQSLNEFIAGMEKFAGKDMGEGGKGFLDEATKFLNRLMEADKIAGHNINFDIKMITDTIAAQSGLQYHTEAQETLSKFLDRINQGNYAVDTLTSTRMYLQDQVQKIVDEAPESDVAKRSKKFLDNLYAQDTLAKVHIGGGASYAGVENIALNTNLFELIEQDGQAEKLFSILKKGSHIAETDVHLQSFVTKYVQSGQLKIRAQHIKDSGTFSEFGNWARSIVSRSSAITPTTNIASIQQLHRTVVDQVLSGNEAAIKGFTLRISGDDLSGLTRQELRKFRGVEGYLSFGEEGYSFTTAEGAHKLSNQNAAMRTIMNTVREAMGPETEETMLVDNMPMTVMRNRAAERIIDTGITYAEGSRLAEIADRVRLNIGTSVSIDDMTDAMMGVYKNLGTGVSATDQIKYILGSDMSGSVFKSGIAEFDSATATKIAQAFAKIGDPMAQILDTQSRVYSSIMAEATSGLAAEAGEAAMRAGATAEAVAHTAHANLTSGMGVSYFKSQEVSRLFDMSTDTFMASSKPMIPQAVFKEAMRQAGFEDRAVRVRLSEARTFDGLRINAAVDIRSMLSRDESVNLSKTIIQIMSDSDQMSRLVGDDIAQRTSMDMASAAQFITEGRVDEAAENLADFMMDRDLVTLQIGGKEAQRVSVEARAAGMILDNDVRNTQTMRVLDSALTDDYAALGPMMDVRAMEKAGLGADLAAAETSVSIGNNKKTSRLLKVVGDQAKAIEDTDGAAKSMATVLSRTKYGLPENKLLDNYLKYKTGIKATGIGVAVAGLAYYLSKRHRETALYDETLAQQPTESNRGQIRSINQDVNNYNSNRSSPMDPLSTAGVVGNMDRMKIGHSKMGNNKYNHLYGG